MFDIQLGIMAESPTFSYLGAVVLFLAAPSLIEKAQTESLIIFQTVLKSIYCT